MKNPLFTGVCTALVTPFLNGEVNYPMLERLIARQLEGGVHAIVLCGTTGEAPTLTDEEKRDIIARAKQVTGDDCLIIAGTGSNDTSHAVRLSRQAQEAGADAVLLIAAMLVPAEYRRLQKFAESLGLAVLSEAHTAGEIAMLLDNGASIVGVNARNLSTFATDLGVVAELMGRIPADKVRVSESALKSNADLKQMKRLGADAFLIGETLMRAASPGEKLCELIAK